MAFIENKYCSKCERYETFCNGVCNRCREREYIQRAASWNVLTVDEKLQDLRKRIEKLEQGEPRY
jgi:hypothetical protein